MFATKKRNPKQLLCQLTAMILIMLLLVSCGGSIPSGGDKPDSEGKAEVTAHQDKQQDKQQDTDPEQQQDKQQDSNLEQQQDEQQDANSEKEQDEISNASDSPSSASQSFTAYTTAKGVLVERLTDALASNPGTELQTMTFFTMVMVDIALIPASAFGLGQDAAITVLGALNVEDIEYSEDGNQYSVKYRDEEGRLCEYQGEYDKAADALKCIAKMDGKEGLIWEYRKTSFGYAGQVYAIYEEGDAFIYQVAVSGKDGAVGFSKEPAAPPALTGSETIDFPKQCQEWYAIKGDAVTGVASDGSEISFVYSPSQAG